MCYRINRAQARKTEHRENHRKLRNAVSILCICAVVNGIAIIKLGGRIKTIEGVIANMVVVDETLVDSVQTITGILNLEG